MIRDILEEFLNHQQLIFLYNRYDSPSNFCAGFLVGLDEKYCIVEAVTPEGRYDGYNFFLIENIERVAYGGQYAEKLEILMQKEHWISAKYSFHPDFLESILEYSLEYQKVLSIELSNSREKDIIGLITQITPGFCEIQCVDSYGHQDEVCVLSTENITKVCCDDEDCRMLQTLMNRNKEV